jgi:hypothetical protein
MEAKLSENDGKGGWLECDYSYLLTALREEVDELEKALIDHPNDPEVVREAADISNYAMMIADKVRHFLNEKKSLLKELQGIKEV